jgi:hypothetical protein
MYETRNETAQTSLLWPLHGLRHLLARPQVLPPGDLVDPDRTAAGRIDRLQLKPDAELVHDALRGVVADGTRVVIPGSKTDGTSRVTF